MVWAIWIEWKQISTVICFSPVNLDLFTWWPAYRNMLTALEQWHFSNWRSILKICRALRCDGVWRKNESVSSTPGDYWEMHLFNKQCLFNKLYSIESNQFSIKSNLINSDRFFLSLKSQTGRIVWGWPYIIFNFRNEGGLNAPRQENCELLRITRWL